MVRNKLFERHLYFKCMCIPLLPADKIVIAFDMLKEKAMSARNVDRKFKDFLRYFEQQWIRNVCVMLIESVIVINLIIAFLLLIYLQEGPDNISVHNLRTRTTSALESYNARLDDNIPAGANFFNFAKCLLNEEAVKKTEFRYLISSGGEFKLTSRQTDRRKAIDEANAILKHPSGTLDDFLARVAFASGTEDLLDNFNIADVADDAFVSAEDDSQDISEEYLRVLGEPSTSGGVRRNRRDDDELWVPPIRNRRIEPNVSPDLVGEVSSSDSHSSNRPKRATRSRSTHSNNEQILSGVPSLNDSGSATKSSSECITCCNAIRSVSFIPCRHMVFCALCYNRHVAGCIEDGSKVWCPVCKRTIEDSFSPILS